MSNIIKHIRIDGLFGTKNIDWELNPSVNVLVGQNGSGKSTILSLIQSTIHQKESVTIDLCSRLKITFVDGSFYRFNAFIHKLNNFNEEILDKLIDTAKVLKPNDNTYLLLTDMLTKMKVIKTIDPERKVPIFESSDNVTPLDIEFISTIDMNANSINNFRTSSGQDTTFLDYEIRNELQRLISYDDSESLKEKLLSALNNLFSETQKTIEFDGNTLVVKIADSTQIDFDKLSSGERQVIFIFLKVVNASVDGALILMDEPEISLHLSWQEKLLNEIRRVNDKSQIIIVTHSPAMLMNGWMDSFVDMKDITTNIEDETHEDSDNSLNSPSHIPIATDTNV